MTSSFTRSARAAASAITVLVLSLGALHAQSAPTPGVWTVPGCRRIVGAANVTYTSDEGATLTPTTRPLRGVGYTMGLVTLDTPNTLLAVFNRTLLRSADAGCRWTSQGEIATTSDGFPVSLAAAPGGRAYGWSENRNDLARIDGTAITYLASPVGSIVGLAADSTNGDHVRLGANDGSVWESMDGGSSRWSQITAAPVGSFPLVYRVAFDPANLDHILVGTASTGVFMTPDGGKNWIAATGLSSTGGASNVFEVVGSPVDPLTVWAEGIDLAENLAGVPSEGRHIYLSRDGGATFRPVIDKSATVTLVNGPTMAAHTTDSDVLYFVFGTSFAGYGTDLFRYDAGTGAFTMTHNSNHGISAITFNPADPAVLYLGLDVEQLSGP